MDAHRAARELRSRAQHLLEEAAALRDDHDDDSGDEGERDEQPRRKDEAAVGNREHQQSDEEAEETAPRQRRQLDDEEERQQQRERRLPAVPALETQVHGKEDEERDDQNDAEMVRIEHERVRAIDVRAADGPVDVDPTAHLPGDRRQHELVEVAPGRLRVGELDAGRRRQLTAIPATNQPSTRQ